MNVLLHAIVPGLLFLAGVFAAYKVGYGAALRDVGATIMELRAKHDAEIDQVLEDLQPFNWADPPVLELAVARGVDIRAAEKLAGQRIERRFPLSVEHGGGDEAA